jgi:hypothetical protein
MKNYNNCTVTTKSKNKDVSYFNLSKMFSKCFANWYNIIFWGLDIKYVDNCNSTDTLGLRTHN